MSGPTTTSIFVDPISTLLVAAGIRAATAVQDGYAEAGRQRQQHQAERDSIEQKHDNATQQQRQALTAAANDAQVRFDQLITLAEQLGIAQQVQASRPAPPASQDPGMQAAYIRALEALNEQLQTVLHFETARRIDELGTSELAIPADTALQRNLATNPPADSKITAQRLLARIEQLGPIPQEISNVALELARTVPGERADLLASDLRLRIQQHIAAIGQRLAQEAAAVIIEQSLKDLGYQVEEIGDTLFVDGGVVHFRRQSWGDYMIRMRINAKGSEANFNVIRAVTAANNEISVLDHIAEDRWCAEFPTLLQSLALRGVHLTVTRRLEAGELPVQLVDAAKLPQFDAQFSDEQEQNQSTQTQLARPLK